MQQAGLLLVNRKRFIVPGELVPYHVDTGLIQTPLGVKPDPPVGGVEPTIDDPGVASRVMVIPLARLQPYAWNLVNHDEPHLGDGSVNEPNVDHVYVTFTNSGEGEITINALFWNPDTKVGPVSAMTYHAQPPR